MIRTDDTTSCPECRDDTWGFDPGILCPKHEQEFADYFHEDDARRNFGAFLRRNRLLAEATKAQTGGGAA